MQWGDAFRGTGEEGYCPEPTWGCRTASTDGDGTGARCTEFVRRYFVLRMYACTVPSFLDLEVGTGMPAVATKLHPKL